MLLSHLNHSFKLLFRNPRYFVLNVISWSICLYSSFVSISYGITQMNYEKSIDEFNNIYRLTSSYTVNGKKTKYANVPRPLGFELQKQRFTQTRLLGIGGDLYSNWTTIEHRNQRHYLDQCYVADSTFFDVFDFELIHGTKKVELNGVWLSESAAIKIFGTSDVIHAWVRIGNNNSLYEVKGIYKEYEKSHLRINLVIFNNDLIDRDQWVGGHCINYVLTRNENLLKEAITRIESDLDRQGKGLPIEIDLGYEPIESIHLHSNLDWDLSDNVDLFGIALIELLGASLLIIAGINHSFIQLLIRQKKSQELVFRKLFGASYFDLLSISLIEGAIVVVMSNLILHTAVYLTNNYNVIPIDFSYEFAVIFFLASIGILLVSSSFFIIKLNHVSINHRAGAKVRINSLFRRLVLSGQVGMSTVLITLTFFTGHQFYSLINVDRGFIHEKSMFIPILPIEFGNVYEDFKKSVKSSRNLKNVTYINKYKPGAELPHTVLTIDRRILTVAGMQGDPLIFKALESPLLYSDSTSGGVYLSSNGISLVDEGISNLDSVTIEFNTSGSQLKVNHVFDFIHFGKKRIDDLPIIFISSKINETATLVVTFEGSREESKAELISVWNQYFPYQYPYIGFFDCFYEQLFNKEQTLFATFKLFSVAGVAITIMGLTLYISSYIQSEIKYITIKKILGASNRQVFISILRIVAGAFIYSNMISIPLSAASVRWWLKVAKTETTFSYFDTFKANIIVLVAVVATTLIHYYEIQSINPIHYLKKQSSNQE